jgi:hypothetical protein
VQGCLPAPLEPASPGSSCSPPVQTGSGVAGDAAATGLPIATESTPAQQPKRTEPTLRTAACRSATGGTNPNPVSRAWVPGPPLCSNGRPRSRPDRQARSRVRSDVLGSQTGRTWTTFWRTFPNPTGRGAPCVMVCWLLSAGRTWRPGHSRRGVRRCRGHAAVTGRSGSGRSRPRAPDPRSRRPGRCSRRGRRCSPAFGVGDRWVAVADRAAHRRPGRLGHVLAGPVGHRDVKVLQRAQRLLDA